MFNETELNEVEYAAIGPDGLSDSPYYFDFLETIGGFNPTTNFTRSITAEEGIGVGDTAELRFGISILQLLQFEDVLTDQNITEASFSVLLGVEATHSLAMGTEFKELFTVAGELELSRVVVIDFLESLVVTGTVDSTRSAVLFLAEALYLAADVKLGGYIMNLAESLGISEEATGNYRAIVSAVEGILLGDTQTMTARMSVFFDEEVVSSQELDGKAIMGLAFSEHIYFGALINTPEGVFEAWVVNAETKAPWQYDNFPFNSFAFAGNKYLALTDSGLYELTGTTDDTETINWVIRTGLENFDSNQKKSIPWAYFGYTSSGRILFKTITTDTGKKVENWYELEARTADDDTETRVNIGRGLRSVYWQFELTNIDGAEFELDDIQLMPARLKRRL